MNGYVEVAIEYDNGFSEMLRVPFGEPIKVPFAGKIVGFGETVLSAGDLLSVTASRGE